MPSPGNEVYIVAGGREASAKVTANSSGRHHGYAHVILSFLFPCSI